MHRLLVLFVTFVSCARMPAPVKLPSEFTAVLPSNCQQVLYVTAADQQATAAELRMLERTPTSDWQSTSAAIPVRESFASPRPSEMNLTQATSSCPISTALHIIGASMMFAHITTIRSSMLAS
ncbi:MAG: hypothetical protein B7Z37_12475 [Verrucomicrobia bacterium 12-59-8]|nr:MAG: hypothetical protein B7Z37_12475 [Verrucomicrobia bacterium 12-59-8]